MNSPHPTPGFTEKKTQPRLFAELGEGSRIEPFAVVGWKYRQGCKPAKLGACALVRAYTIIYADTRFGDHLQTGHHALILEGTLAGDRIVVGSHAVIDGQTKIGSYVKIETAAYVPTHTTIGSRVFIGPGAVLTNDRYPQRLRQEYEPTGPVLEDGVTVGANATIMPGVRIGKGSFIAAGALVSKDVPAWSLATGVPAKIQPLPGKLKEMNHAKHWGGDGRKVRPQ